MASEAKEVVVCGRACYIVRLCGAVHSKALRGALVVALRDAFSVLASSGGRDADG